MRKVGMYVIFFLIINSATVMSSSVWAQEITEDSWNTKAPMTSARANLGVVAVDGKIYAIGGSDAKGVMGSNECYDPVADTWVTLASMPTPRHNFAIVAYQGKIYCIAGSDNVGFCSTNEVYDIVTNTWSTKASILVTGWDMQAHVIDEKIFVLNRDRELYMYEPLKDSWTKKASIPLEPVDTAVFTSAVINDALICIDTFYSETSKTEEYRIFNYDPKTDVWNEKNLPHPNNTLLIYSEIKEVPAVTTGLYAPQKIYFFELTYTESYDFVDDTWTTTTVMPTSRSTFGIGVVNDIIYVIGGYDFNEGVVLSVNEQYIPIGYSALPIVTSPLITPVTPRITPVSFEPVLTDSIIVVAVITVGAVSGGIFFFFKKRKKPAKNQEQTKREEEKDEEEKLVWNNLVISIFRDRAVFEAEPYIVIKVQKLVIKQTNKYLTGTIHGYFRLMGNEDYLSFPQRTNKNPHMLCWFDKPNPKEQTKFRKITNVHFSPYIKEIPRKDKITYTITFTAKETNNLNGKQIKTNCNPNKTKFNPLKTVQTIIKHHLK